MSARGRLARAGLALGATLGALLSAEIALRVLDVRPDRFPQTARLETEDKRVGLDLYPDDPRGAFPIDLRDPSARSRWVGRFPELAERWARAPHGVAFRYSEELCRGDVPAPSERRRVLVVGDSFAEGQGVVEAETFAARLESALDAEVINCARRGYDFPTLRTWFEARLSLEPDVALYAMVLNDPERSEAFQARQRYIDDWIVDRRRMFSRGDGSPPFWEPRFFSLVADRVEGVRVQSETTRWYREMVGPENAEGWAATLAHVEAMDAAMRARGGRLVVAIWPLLVDLDDYPFEATHARIREALEARGVTVVDTLDAFRGRDAASLWVHPADRHPNGRAHALFAEAVRPALE